MSYKYVESFCQRGVFEQSHTQAHLTVKQIKQPVISQPQIAFFFFFNTSTMTSGYYLCLLQLLSVLFDFCVIAIYQDTIFALKTLLFIVQKLGLCSLVSLSLFLRDAKVCNFLSFRIYVFVEYHEIIILEASNLICLSKIMTHLFAVVCSQHCSQLDRKTCNTPMHTCTHTCTRLWFSVPIYRTVLQIKWYYKQICFHLIRVQTQSQ